MRRFLIDENISPEYRTQLLRREPSLTVLAIGDEGAPPKGTQDPEILKWCEQNNFILVTKDPNTIPKHLSDHREAGNHVPGILMVKSSGSMGTILDNLILIAGASNEDEYIDRITYIPL
ncbi:MAG: DUF5615 family PIN-like protein [Candidatus Poribacteria bacterium]|nr:DUF5615 family PIN-like protein [Candidatus Poribacteria bacterium]